MIVKVNNYSFANNEAMVTFFGAGRIYNDRGKAQILRQRMVVEGELLASTPAALSTKAAQVMSALSVDGGFCQLLEASGAATSFIIGGATSLGGIKLVEAPIFTMQDGKAHFATAIPFSFTVEADYLVDDNDSLVSYSETIARIGTGAPRKRTIELDNGVPVKQTVSSSTPVVVIQAGEAVGILSYPVPNAPLFPNDMDDPEDNQIIERTPRMENGLFLDYSVRWNYRFTLTTNVGIPHPLAK